MSLHISTIRGTLRTTKLTFISTSVEIFMLSYMEYSYTCYFYPKYVVCSKEFLYHLYGMFNIWQKLSAFPIISSISFQLSSSWGEQITNCSTLEKEESKVNNETATDLFKLMHPEDTPGVPPMAAHLEARWEKGWFLLNNYCQWQHHSQHIEGCFYLRIIAIGC